VSEPGKVADGAATPAASGRGGPPGGVPGSSGAARAGQPGLRLVAIATVTVAAVAAGIIYGVTHSSPARSASSQQAHAADAIRVTSISPGNQAANVDGANPIIVTFSGQVSSNSAKPKLSPRVPGTWTATGNTLEFMPSTPFQQLTQVTVEVPAGSSGVHAADGGLLSTAVTSRFTTAAYSQAGLAVLLAQQGYLPMNWEPVQADAALTQLESTDPAAETPQGIAYDPPPGIFTWQPGYPPQLQAQWVPNQANVILEGAVMAFKSEHNMTIDGSLPQQLWTALFQAQENGELNANGYTYAIANKGTPETLTIWHNGQVVLTSLANTGISVAPTVDGTFPVYARFLNTIMSGFNPDGSYYSDPVQFVSYFNGGDAVHYFARGSYGWPQSLGCVELPYNDAEQAYPYLTYGSLVTVQG